MNTKKKWMKRRLAFVLAILLCVSCFTGNLSLNVSAEEENSPVFVEQEQTAAESDDPEGGAPEGANTPQEENASQEGNVPQEENTPQEGNVPQEGNTSQEEDAPQKDNSIQDAGQEPTEGEESKPNEGAPSEDATPEESPQPDGEEETCTVRFAGEGSQTLAILIGSETVDASYTAEISRADEFCFTLVPREGAQIGSVTAQGAEIEKVGENEYVLRQITEGEVTVVVETAASEDGAQTEDPSQTEIPQEVQAFLDAAKALLSADQITQENAKQIGEEADAALELWKALDESFLEREDVKAALEKVNAVHEAVRALLDGEEEESDEIPYYLYVAHSLELDGERYGAAEIIRLEKEDFQDGAYDLHQNIMQKEGMEEAKASYLDNETYDLTEGWTVYADDFEEAGDPEDGSNYYGMYALIEYQVAEGYHAVVSDNPTPVDDPYGIMLLIGLTGNNIADITFVPAKLITVTVEYMFSPTGGLRGTHAADTQKYQVEVPAQGESTKTWDLPNENDGNNPGLEGFRIVLDPGPLNEYLVNPELANRADEGNASDAEIQNALENDYFTVDTANKTVYEWQALGHQKAPESYDAYPENATYHNRYSTQYNQAWESARKLTAENGNYTVEAIPGQGSAVNQGANALNTPKLQLTLKAGQTDDITVTVYYRRNAGFYYVDHWVPKGNLTAAQQNEYTQKYSTVNVAGNSNFDNNYIMVYQERKQGRVGAMTNARSNPQVSEAAVLDAFVPVGFSQKVIEADTTVDVLYTTTNRYRLIFNTDDIYIPRQQLELGNRVKFKLVGDSSTMEIDTGSGYTAVSEYAIPKRTGYTFGGWKYEVKTAAAADANLEDGGKHYRKIADDGSAEWILYSNATAVESDAMDIANIVLANDVDDNVKAIYLYPIWTPATANVRVVFWTEDLGGGNNDVDVDVQTPNGNYQTHAGDYLNGTPNTVGTSFSNVGSFTFTAASESTLNLSVGNQKLASTTSGSFTATEGGTATGTLSNMIDTLFAAKMGNVQTSQNPVAASKFYHPVGVSDNSGNSQTSLYGEQINPVVAADGSRVINVYYARNVYKADFTYYGRANNRLSVAVNTIGYTALGNPSNYNVNNSGNANVWVSVTNQSNPNWTVPEKITITAKYGADIRDVWPNSNGETIAVTPRSGHTSPAIFVSWATTAGPYRDKYIADTSVPGGKGESTLMGIYSAMSADIIADPDSTNTIHHMYAYWFDGEISYYRFNHCYEVPGLAESDVTSADGMITYDLTSRTFGHSGNATGNSAANANRNNIYLIPRGGSLSDSFVDYDQVLLKVDRNAQEADNGAYYAVRCYGGKVYALARQVNAPSGNNIGSQNPSARLHMTRANTTPDHDTRTQDTDGNHNNKNSSGDPDIIGTSAAPYDLFFYYDRDLFTITYMVPARDSATGEYELGTRRVPFGSSLSRYKVTLGNADKGLYSDNAKFNNAWTASNTNTPLQGVVDASGYVRVAPDSAANGTGIWQFNGWNLDRAGTTEMTEAAWAGSVSGNLRLFADWEAPVYRVKFDLNGGIYNNSVNFAEQEVSANQGYTSSGKPIPRPLRNGYVLQDWEWYPADETADGLVIKEGASAISGFGFENPITQNMVAVAQWKGVTKDAYNYKVWYLTDDASVTNPVSRPAGITGQWLDSRSWGTPGTDADPPSGLVTTDFTNILGCQYFTNQDYPADTNLLVGALNIEGYIPVKANAAIELDLTKNGTAANDTQNVAYFYYRKVQTKSYKIEFKLLDGSGSNGLDQITQTGTTSEAYFTPSESSFQALKAAGYQLAVLDQAGNVKLDGNGKPIAAKSYTDLQEFIEAENGKFAAAADGSAFTVTFKVMPITYSITYNVGDVMLNGGKIEPSASLKAAMQRELDDRKNTHNGGEVSAAQKQNPQIYDVTDFNNNFSFTLLNPTYVQDPDHQAEWWKFTGWSLGNGTSANSTTRAVTGEYPELEVSHAVGDLEFLANWERVTAGVTITNRVITESGTDVPADAVFDYSIALPGNVSLADVLVYRTDANGTVTRQTLTSGRFQLKNGESISFDGFEGAYTATQTITGTMFDTSQKNYFTLTQVAGAEGTNDPAAGIASAALGAANPRDDVVFTNTYTATVDLDTDPGQAGNQGFPVTKYLLENGVRRNFFGGNDYTFLIRRGAQSGADTGAETPVPGSVILTSRADVQSLTGHFDSVRFTKTGTYTYVISEQGPSGTSAVPGVSYDSSLYRVTVRVDAAGSDLTAGIVRLEKRTTADTSGGTSAGWTEIAGGAADLNGGIAFENTYNTTQVNRTFRPVKELQNRDTPLAEGEFSFTLTPAGSLAVSEAQAQEYHARSTDEDKLAYLKGLDGSFREDSSQPMPGNLAEGNKITNGSSGAVNFGSITYTSADMGGNAHGKIYKYTLKEDVPEGAVNGKYRGMIYDTQERTLYVYVHLHSVNGGPAVLGDADTLVYGDVLGDRNSRFVNRYESTPVDVDLGEDENGSGTDTVIALEKQLNGRSFLAGDSFTFTLQSGLPGAPMPLDKDGKEVSRVTITPTQGNTAGIYFGRFTFEEAGVYTYTLREERGTAAGMNYDTETKKVTITVTDEGEGHLKAAVDVARVTWINRYESGAVIVDIGGTDGSTGVRLEKQLNGREFAAGDSFTFTLEPVTADAPMPKKSDGADVTTAVIAPSQGNLAEVIFGRISFTKEGTYTYLLREQEGTAQKMSYDTMPRQITITVSDNNGILTAAVDQNVTWVNTYNDSDPAPGPDSNPDSDSDPDSDTGSDSAGGDSDPALASVSDSAAAGSDPTPGSASNPDTGALPQTGMLWWPVWLLVIAGAVMLGIGIFKKKASRGKDEE